MEQSATSRECQPSRPRTQPVVFNVLPPARSTWDDMAEPVADGCRAAPPSPTLQPTPLAAIRQGYGGLGPQSSSRPAKRARPDDGSGLLENPKCVKKKEPVRPPYLCLGGCDKFYTTTKGRDLHWIAYGGCEERHAERVRGTQEWRGYQESLRRRIQSIWVPPRKYRKHSLRE